MKSSATTKIQMKRIIAGAAALLVGFSTAQAQQIKLGEALVFRELDLKPDADAKEFEASVLNELAPAWKLNAPGMELHLVRKDRGNHKGQYLLAYTTDTLTRHQSYASANAPPPHAAAPPPSLHFKLFSSSCSR